MLQKLRINLSTTSLMKIKKKLRHLILVKLIHRGLKNQLPGKEAEINIKNSTNTQKQLREITMAEMIEMIETETEIEIEEIAIGETTMTTNLKMITYLKKSHIEKQKCAHNLKEYKVVYYIGSMQKRLRLQFCT